MSIAGFEGELLCCIISDAKEKYNLTSEIEIIFNENKSCSSLDELALKKVEEWIERVILFKEKFVQYVYLGGNRIELKEYFINPSIKGLQEIVEEFFVWIDKRPDNSLFEFMNNLYNKAEIKNVVKVEIKLGSTMVSIQDETCSFYEYLKEKYKYIKDVNIFAAEACVGEFWWLMHIGFIDFENSNGR